MVRASGAPLCASRGGVHRAPQAARPPHCHWSRGPRRSCSGLKLVDGQRFKPRPGSVWRKTARRERSRVCDTLSAHQPSRPRGDRSPVHGARPPLTALRERPWRGGKSPVLAAAAEPPGNATGTSGAPRTPQGAGRTVALSPARHAGRAHSRTRSLPAEAHPPGRAGTRSWRMTENTGHSP